MLIKKSLIGAATAAALGFNALAVAQIESKQDASGIVWHTAEVFHSATLTISGPSGQSSQQSFYEGESLFLDFSALEKMAMGDGAYRFELVLNPATLVSGKDAELVQRLRALGEDTSFAEPDSLSTHSGSFVLSGGQAINPELAEASMQKDIVQNDDVIINQSLCVGQDCNNGENFGFDTVRLKENNLRLHFDDTSNSASFPSNDWRIVANDSGNGGASYLAIEDATAGRQPFRVDAGAPANSLRVDSAGDVGIGNSNPVVPLHVTDGDSPTMRLEQDGSSGFTPQTWDVAGNETNFFVRDVTNGSRLPFKIKPNAPDNSIFVAANGMIGLGTQTPNDELHVVASNPARLRLTNTSITNSTTVDQDWIMNSNGTFRISAGADSAELQLNASGDLMITGSLTTSGTTCGSGCDLVFSSDYQLESIDDHASSMWQRGYLPNVGATKEGEPINLSEKTGRMLNELEKAHIYIEQLHKRLEVLEAKLKE